jgi:hypothetical protein
LDVRLGESSAPFTRFRLAVSRANCPSLGAANRGSSSPDARHWHTGVEQPRAIMDDCLDR